LEQADASVSVEYAQAHRRGSRDGATCLQRRRQGRSRSGRLPPERALPACGSGARRECPPRIRASTRSTVLVRRPSRWNCARVEDYVSAL